MSILLKQNYVPVLRLKKGEYLALAELATDVSERICPHFVVPPPSERDPEQRRVLTPDEIVHESGQRVGRHWPLRPCMLDARHLFGVLGDADSERWLPRLFEIARDANAVAIPTFTLADIEGEALLGIRRAIEVGSIGMALRLSLRDLGDTNLRARVHRACLKLALKPDDCILILDLSNADLSSPELVGEAFVAYYQQVSEIGLWGRVVVEATSYPEVNPAPAGGEVFLPRNEWLAWKHAATVDGIIRANLMFGDFAADSAKFSFSANQITAIRHYRYSAEAGWLVVRAPKDDKVAPAMARLASLIVNSEHFAGAGFSKADRVLFDGAQGAAGPGNASTWRQINTGHHVTRVVSDLGPFHAYRVRRGSEPVTQGSLFG